MNMTSEERIEKLLTDDFIKKVNKYKKQLKKELKELCNSYLNKKENNVYNKLQFKNSFDDIFKKYGIDMSITILNRKGNEFYIVGTDAPSYNVIQYCIDNKILLNL